MKDLYLGGIVTIYSRQLKVVDYADVFTRKAFESQKSRTLALIKPNAYDHIGKIMDIIYANGLAVNRLKMLKMKLEDAQEFYAEHKGKPFFEALTTMMSSEVVVAMELIADDAVAKWRQLLGPTEPAKAKAEAPSSVRALFGIDGTKNAAHGSDSSMACLEAL